MTHRVPHRLSRAVVLLTVLGAALPAAAQSRPYAPSLSCARLQALLERSGAAVLSTGPRTYDRFVRDGRFCQSTEVTEAAWVRASDDPDCFIGYTCKEADRDDQW
ncbi:hypothetical protein JOD31_000335 [Methylopila capsulata]|uniref:YARHG domain-containing protein n=1 Tax=Methylopila capsulata TaxID=61654 RepID=A0A9W6ITR3_9HYPH|nr:hypothetical protein [Methylopila capsulata]MBM7850123.1 hypothetical protein [Methylopila capsulata]GLK55414.1 hypothetical protein GCM10008170_14330 [Methylopila capsulata]